MQPKSQFSSVSGFIYQHRPAFIFLLVFLIDFLLVSPALMPEYSAINSNDEAKYVDSGWRLLKGEVRDLAWGPLVALVYAPTHLIVGSLPNWFMIETWVGRYILFAFLWWSIFYLAFQVQELLSPYIMLGVLFLAAPFISVVVNQSDAVFVGFSALALAQLIRFYHSRKLRNLAAASALVGLGVLSRVETILLVGILLFFGIYFGWRLHPLYKLILAAVIPAACVLGLIFIYNLIRVGNLNLGIGYKSYDSFEVNQSVLTGGDLDKARQETQRLFGTQEENHGSVLRAILRNPGAFALRIAANAKTIPDNYLVFFGKRLGFVLLLFAAWGVYVFIRERSIPLLLIFLFWVVHAVVPLGFLALHIIPQISYLPLILGAVGITWIFGPEVRPTERAIFLFINLGVVLFSVIYAKPAITFGFLMITFVMLLFWLTQDGWRLSEKNRLAPLFCLLTAGLILHGSFPFPDYPPLGQTEQEKAIHYLFQNLASQTKILAPTPLQALAAKLDYVTYDNIPLEIDTLQEFRDWLKEKNVYAIFLDSNRRVRNDLYDLMETGWESYFDRVYISEDGSIRIFNVK
jgi:MFS family permease